MTRIFCMNSAFSFIPDKPLFGDLILFLQVSLITHAHLEMTGRMHDRTRPHTNNMSLGLTRDSTPRVSDWMCVCVCVCVSCDELLIHGALWSGSSICTVATFCLNFFKLKNSYLHCRRFYLKFYTGICSRLLKYSAVYICNMAPPERHSVIFPKCRYQKDTYVTM